MAAAAPVGAMFAIATKVGIYAILRLTMLLFAAGSGPSADWARAADRAGHGHGRLRHAGRAGVAKPGADRGACGDPVVGHHAGRDRAGAGGGGNGCWRAPCITWSRRP
ncbi:hypothetical protein FLP41_16325 [Paracoccus marcusii]|uniref:hypothetical protein n=1 Tax=Paracoccus marcusii TaxID=59779 RepID=UPI002ED057AD|nr:hypothetical protein FLP41_16325 [Paracoccus marcusii]